VLFIAPCFTRATFAKARAMKNNGGIRLGCLNGRYGTDQNVSILDFISAKDDGGDGDKWNYKMCKAPGRSSPLTNQHPAFYRPAELHQASGKGI